MKFFENLKILDTVDIAARETLKTYISPIYKFYIPNI